MGLVAGSLAIRRQGIYFAMITLALAQMMYFFAVQAKFTGGEDGIQAVPRGHLFGLIDLRNEMAMYVVVLVIFLAGFLFIYRIIHSPFGEVLKAIRENEPRAISLGYKTDRYKLVAFVLSATLAGLAGATKAIVLQIASLTDVNWPMSGEVVLMTLVGGLGTIFGPVVGAFVILRCSTSCRRRRVGAGHPGRDFRRLRAAVPPRHYRRARQYIAHPAVTNRLARLFKHWQISLHDRSSPQPLCVGVHCATAGRHRFARGSGVDGLALATERLCRSAQSAPLSMKSPANGAILPIAGSTILSRSIKAAAGSITTRATNSRADGRRDQGDQGLGRTCRAGRRPDGR